MTLARPTAPVPVTEPLPISFIAGRYLIFDINAITQLRAKHNICGVLSGSIPHLPQQNVFLGIPLELMPEEARLLVERNIGFIVDDVAWHRDGLHGLRNDEKQAFLETIRGRGLDITKAAAQRAKERSEMALEKQRAKLASSNPPEIAPSVDSEKKQSGKRDADDKESIFTSPTSSTSPQVLSRTSLASAEPHVITSTTSYPPLPQPPHTRILPQVPPSYPLFAYLHAQKYFLSPGLRFGCQYLAYPGDPLRFHSHFLAVGFEWDEELNLMDLVAGGRLGTGVKKGFLIGGVKGKDDVASEQDGPRPQTVRTFCIEWGGM